MWLVLKENWTDDLYTTIEDTFKKEHLTLVLKSFQVGNIMKFDGDTTKDKLFDLLTKTESNITYSLEFQTFQTYCDSGKNRTIHDIYHLMHTENPEITLKEIKTALFELVNDRKIATLWCNGLRKRVFTSNMLKYGRFNDENVGNVFHLHREDEYGQKLQVENNLTEVSDPRFLLPAPYTYS